MVLPEAVAPRLDLANDHGTFGKGRGTKKMELKAAMSLSYLRDLMSTATTTKCHTRKCWQVPVTPMMNPEKLHTRVVYFLLWSQVKPSASEA